MRLRRVRSLIGIGLALAASGCIPSTYTPDRLFPAPLELDLVRNTQVDLSARYYDLLGRSPEQARQIRNEIIAQRLYAVDIQFVQYEASLTRERQEIGFGAVTAAQALSTAATLAAPGAPCRS